MAGFYVSEAPILSLYAAGKLTGTAVDIGAEKIGADKDAPLFGFRQRGVSRARRRHLPGV